MNLFLLGFTIFMAIGWAEIVRLTLETWSNGKKVRKIPVAVVTIAFATLATGVLIWAWVTT
jgi:hypothetical protein